MAKEEKKKADEKPVELTPEEAAAKARKKKLIIIIAGLSLVLIGGGVAAMMLLSGGNKMAAKPSDQPAETTPATPATETPPAAGEAAKPAEGSAATTPAAAGAQAQTGTQAAAPKPSNIDFGCTHSFEPFHLNLGNPLENRYIRLEIAIEYGCAEEIENEIKKRLPQLRDAVIAVTSQKTREALLSPDGKAQLTREIHNRVNHYMTNKVDNIFITDILIE